jgi:hypothetical protein
MLQLIYIPNSFHSQHFIDQIFHLYKIDIIHSDQQQQQKMIRFNRKY